MIFNGVIKVSKKHNYAYFSMDTATVRKVMIEPFDELRTKMKERQIGGNLYICRVDDFDGNIEHIILMYLIILHERTSYITLWMLSERVRNQSVNSITQWVGRRGTFRVSGWYVIKTDSIILLVVSGNKEYIVCNIYLVDIISSQESVK